MSKLILSSFFIALIMACAENDKSTAAGTANAVDGATIYKKYCVLCHGANGKLGLNGSKDITASVLTKAERMVLIKNGKNAMTPFSGILSDEEIEAVAEYTFTLKSL